MKRIVDHFLRLWKQDSLRQPLLMRGARQVGKTYAVRQLGATYKNFVEINLEDRVEARAIFEKDLDPVRMLAELSLVVRKPIEPGSTLLFLDEIQVVPRAITALRYFYEKMPELHVVAAGSLLDFAIEEVGVPVGRVQSLYLRPVSFAEFLAAMGEEMLLHTMFEHDVAQEISPVAHHKLLGLLGEFLALGGMPQVVHHWATRKEPLGCIKLQHGMLDTYRQDFEKYARESQVKYVELVFRHIPALAGKKFKFSAIDGEYRKRELSPALDLLVTAGIAHKIYHSSGQGMPLGAQIDPQDYKVILFDVGLAQAALGLDVAQWFLQPQLELVNKGQVAESFVGQEFLAYANPHIKSDLWYWHKEVGGEAEIDYLVPRAGQVIPVEVKSGAGRTLQSLNNFLVTHAKSPYGIRLSTQNYSCFNKVYSYPLYAIAAMMSEQNDEMRRAVNSL